MTDFITQLYPVHEDRSLEGLYLNHSLRDISTEKTPFVYSNYIVSLDGRIAVADKQADENTVPDSISNPRDWRLYQELAAQADILITSARFIRQLVKGTAQDMLPLSSETAYADLHRWRKEHNLPPQPALVILSSGYDLPLADVYHHLARPFYVATGEEAAERLRRPVEDLGGKLLISGPGNTVEGKLLVTSLAEAGFQYIYSIAGPIVLKTLIDDNVLKRLYVTQVHRLIGGASYDTLLESDLAVHTDLKLIELYYDSQAIDGVGQLLGIYEVTARLSGKE